MKKKKFKFNIKRLLCGLVAAVLSLCCFTSSICFAIGSENDIMSPDGNGNVSSYVYPNLGGVGYAYFYLRKGASRYLKLNGEFRSNFYGGYSSTYAGIGTNDVKCEVRTPITESTYKYFSNTIVTERFTYELPYLNNFSQATEEIAVYNSYNQNTYYPLCTGFNIPFALYSFYLSGKSSINDDEVLNVYHQFYGADVYALVYSIDYDDDGEEILLSKWVKTSFDGSSMSVINDRDNVYSKDNLIFANSGSISVSFDRPVLLQKIVIDFRFKVNTKYSLTNVYSDLPQSIKDELADCRTLIVFNGYALLDGYNIAYNYSLFKSMGLAEDLSASIMNGTDIADILQSYKSSAYSSLENVLQDNLSAFGVVGDIVSELFATKLISGLIISVCALAVLGAFIALGLRVVGSSSNETKRINRRDENRAYNEQRYIKRRDENRRYYESRGRKR